PLFIFHTAFIVILVGAAITRYFGFEGTMHLREKESSALLVSSDTYLTIRVQKGEKQISSEDTLYLSKKTSNNFSTSLNMDDKKIKVSLAEYIHDAVEEIVPADENAPGMAEMMVTTGAEGKPITLVEGAFYETSDFILDFNSKLSFTKPVISLFVEEDELYMNYPMDIKTLKMDSGEQGVLPSSEKELVASRTLFTALSQSFVLKSFLPHAKMELVSNPSASPQNRGYDALRFTVEVDGVTKEVTALGRNGVIAQEHSVLFDDLEIMISYGAKEIALPFELYLEKFDLERYPGSMSPSSYASEVVVKDTEQNLNMPYRIYMNHILEHRGYRFFQASYDQDEKGTILSVNNDPGTLPSYIGYFLLTLGMFWSLFSRGNRFDTLAKKAKKASGVQVALLVAVATLLSTTPSYAKEVMDPSLEIVLGFDAAHAKKFGELVVQDSGGRMKPLNTLATQVVAKLYQSDSVKIGKYKLDANQVILGMMIRPDIYRDVKIIKTKDEEINKLLGIKNDARYASFSQFFVDPENMAGYKLQNYVEEAVRKEPKHRDNFDKNILKIDEKVNIAYMVFTGDLVKIWPKPNDISNKWLGTIEALRTLDIDKANQVREIAINYFTSVDVALEKGEWERVDDALLKLEEYQRFYGSEVYPSANRITAEMFYNKANIFERLFPFYMIAGFALLILSFIKILKPNFRIEIFTKITLWALIIFFVAHTVGLINRWYISGHAPWSDGYESMIYIGWATVLAGFIFSKRSPMTMASTGILTGLILFVAHLNWMDPQITNLVPVLNSYWLSIHVSMITASYGFLGLGALLGFIVLLLFAIKSAKNSVQIGASIKELSAINEMSLMIGLILL
ncbi:MAG: cytochrome c biogenesis protein ResB, partial [Sulfurimonadaceae bacterium]|nr:cytochrome c biogenesis protein ResB [Sulfurimonadaceae bacterium]